MFAQGTFGRKLAIELSFSLVLGLVVGSIYAGSGN